MLSAVDVTERGIPAGMMRRLFNNLRKRAFKLTAEHHHRTYTERRFDPSHARLAGYHRRKGELLPPTSAGFRRSYYGRKLRSEAGGGRGRADPLVFSGRSRARAQTANVTSTNKAGRITWNLPVFNFRHPKSQINMRDEFTRVLDHEARDDVRVFDSELDRGIREQRATTRKKIN